MADSLTYVYCLVRSARRPRARAALAGVSGSDLRMLAAGGGLWIVVSTVSSLEYNEAALAKGLQTLDWVGRRAIAHESVVEQFLSATAVLPMQLFTLFTSDARAVEHVTRDRSRIDRILSRVERKLEWGLRLTFDEKSVREQVETRARRRTGKTPAEPGSAYLARKRDLLDVNRVQLAGARARADRLYRAMSREAAEALRRSSTEQAAPGSRLLLDAAFLVPAGRASAFRAALRRSGRDLRASGLAIALTGPWPAYNFVDVPARVPARPRRTRAARSAK